jgi:hypothetical protein
MTKPQMNVQKGREKKGTLEARVSESAVVTELIPLVSSLQGFAPTSTFSVLHVPSADHWQCGTSIKSQQGRSDALPVDVFHVLRSERVGRTRWGDPIFRAVLGDIQDQMVAVILREIDYRRMKDTFVFYSVTPTWPGQPARKKDRIARCDLYPFASLEASPLGRNYRLYACKDHELLLKASNPNIRCTRLCCALCCTLCCLYGWLPWQWKLTFRKPGNRKDAVILWNQMTAQVTVTAGTSPLLAVCMSYALDRLTTPTC